MNVDTFSHWLLILDQVRVDLVSQFDAIDEESSVYSVGGQRHFMPYVPAYAVCGPADLALFSPADTD